MKTKNKPKPIEIEIVSGEPVEHRLPEESDYQYVSRVYGTQFLIEYQTIRFLRNNTHKQAMEITLKWLEAQTAK